MKLCEYAIDKSTALQKILECSITHQLCGFCRYCINDRCLKMTPSFYKYGCKILNEIKGVNTMDNKSTTRSKKSTAKRNNRSVKKEATEKIIAVSLYNKGSKTAISYVNNGAFCSVFIDGIYNNKIEIEYKNGELKSENIIRITEI